VLGSRTLRRRTVLSQHRQIPTRGPQPPASLQPVEAGHHQVEDQQIQRVTVGPTDLVEHGETVGDGAGVVTLDLEHPLQRLTDGRIMIRTPARPLPVDAFAAHSPRST
jgi:hypothetical protein